MPIKIIDLQAEDNPTDDDLIVIRDNLTQTTRKVTRARFFSNPPLPANSVTNTMLADGAVSKRNLGADAKIGVRANVQSSPGVLQANVDDYEVQAVTNLNSGINLANPTGTPVNAQGLMFRIRDNGNSQTISYGSQFRPIGVTLPTATIAGRVLYLNARWNAQEQTWDILGIGRQG